MSQVIYNNYSDTITRTMAWLELAECERDIFPATKGNNTVFYSYNEILSLSQEASMVKIAPDRTEEDDLNSGCNNYTVISKLSSQPLKNLRNGYELSFIIEEVDGTFQRVERYNWTNQWFGTHDALTKLWHYYELPEFNTACTEGIKNFTSMFFHSFCRW